MRRIPDDIQRELNRLAHSLAQATYTAHRRLLETEALLMLKAGHSSADVIARLDTFAVKRTALWCPSNVTPKSWQCAASCCPAVRAGALARTRTWSRNQTWPGPVRAGARAHFVAEVDPCQSSTRGHTRAHAGRTRQQPE